MKRARPRQHTRRLKSGKRIVINKGVRPKAKRAMDRSTIKYLEEKGAKPYLVGGKVRDELMNVPSKDIDYLVTGLPQEDLVEYLQKRGSVATDKNMGVIKFRDALIPGKGLPDDIVLPRKEQPTGGGGHRDFLIEYDPDLPVEDDLYRRDFTINAMAKDALTGEVIDPYGGRKDLESKKIRLVNPEAFQDDPLRMLRAGQFAARFGSEIDAETAKAMADNRMALLKEPKERVAEELRKGFGKGRNPEKMFDAFYDTGILDVMIPEVTKTRGLEQNKYHAYTVDKHTREVVKNMGDLTAGMPPNRRFTLGMAALLHDLGKPAAMTEKPGKGRQFIGHEEYSTKIAQRVVNELKLSNDEKKHIKFLVENHGVLAPEMSDKKFRRLLDKYGEQNVRDLVTFRQADLMAKGNMPLKEVKANIRLYTDKIDKNLPITYGINELAINGSDLVNKYHMKGPIVGETMRLMHKSVLSNPSLNNEKDLIGYIPARYRK